MSKPAIERTAALRLLTEPAAQRPSAITVAVTARQPDPRYTLRPDEDEPVVSTAAPDTSTATAAPDTPDAMSPPIADEVLTPGSDPPDNSSNSDELTEIDNLVDSAAYSAVRTEAVRHSHTMKQLGINNPNAAMTEVLLARC